MIYAVFSDIHSNIEAYKAFLEDTKKEEVESFYCAGDIVGYGANPRECIEVTRKLGCPVVCGNHDWAAAGRLSADYFNRHAKEAVSWTAKVLNNAEKDYLRRLAAVYQETELTLVHGSLNSPEDFEYIMDELQAKINIDLQITQVCFIGHTHVAGIFYDDRRGGIEYTTAPELYLDDERRYLVNVGSLGQPRDGDWRASYCLYDTEKSRIRIKRIEYDVKSASKAILNAGLPGKLATRILSGQ